MRVLDLLPANGEGRRILCDVDGVVADLMPEWLYRINRDYHAHYRVDQITGWDVHKYVNLPPAVVYKYLRDKNLYLNVKPIAGAREGITTLRARGYRVAFVTSCVNGTFDQKAQWLARNGFSTAAQGQPGSDNIYSDIIAANDKSWFAADYMIDDGVHNLEVFSGVPLVFDQPWNQETERDWARVTW